MAVSASQRRRDDDGDRKKIDTTGDSACHVKYVWTVTDVNSKIVATNDISCFPFPYRHTQIRKSSTIQIGKSQL